ncbi:MAG: hypothetical protein JW999_08110 [Methanotrichaceae archaeon]|nr:hypothetical protein [Methanotrichaceae archaeon]
MIDENQLDEWVRGHARDAQGLIVELIYRLVAASSPEPKRRRFPLGDSIGQSGPDGILDTDFGFPPFVPEGISYWEIGTGVNAGNKATSDYSDLTDRTPVEVRLESAFIFVTPLSGRRDWQYSWKENAQATWIREKRERNEWKEVCVIDGTVLIDWLRHFPAVELWLANAMGFPAQQIESVEQHWIDLKEIGSPPPLIPDIFLANRDGARAKLKDLFNGITLQLKLDTHFPSQVADFIAAHIESLDRDAKMDLAGRCLIISCAEAWKAIMNPLVPHFLVADFDLNDDSGTKLLSGAQRAGHKVVYRGLPGGIPHPNKASLPNPRSNQVKEALEKAGYSTEKARTIAQKSGGNLGAMLRLLHNLSLMPEWAQGTDASELAIAELLGAWSDQSEADKAVAEKLSGKAYGEWIRIMREIALRPDTPLNHHNETWKVISRYEGWYALGPNLFDDHLNCFKKIAVEALRERDPQFELQSDKRLMASIYGKVLDKSYPLRRGLAESLALIGSHPEALKSCSTGKANETSVLAIREILSDADWILWASLNDLLPLLAEASPDEFLKAVEMALNSENCPFDAVFAQEGSGILGRNYMTGLLWALETLAWDADYLIRVVVLLSQLAEKDPGGNWANRPANSLSTILLPWFPQTCAPVPMRKAAVSILIKEHPEVAWNLLLSLLPQSHQISHGSRKPAWREIIPDDWFERASPREYYEQVDIYAELITSAAMSNLSKLVSLIDRLNDFPPQARDQILAHLGSDALISMPEAKRIPLWTEITNLIIKHRKFVDSKWAMKADEVDKISKIAEKLEPKSPIYRHRRLFSERDFDLYEKIGDHEELIKALDDRRQKAVVEISELEGMDAVLEFAKAVESPWRVGFALGVSAQIEAEPFIFPSLLDSEDKSQMQFVGGFVRGRFLSRQWQWVDEIDTNAWTTSQKGQFLAFLPFISDTWKLLPQLLREDESPYWSKTNVNPDGGDQNLEMAIDRLIEHGRAHEAILCFEQMRYKKRRLNSRQAVRVLQAMLHSSDDLKKMDAHAVVEVIKALQDDMSTNQDDLSQIEFAFLPLLDGHLGASPKLLEQRLADDPEFFCEIIRAVFRSNKEDSQVEEPTEKKKNIASLAYSLLHNWRTPPGSQKDGTYNGEAMEYWLGRVKEICRESEHLDIGLSTAGQVFIHIPSDPDGFWMHHSAAKVLNAKENKRIRDGYLIARINSRGGYFSTAGENERKLAAEYRERAEEAEAHGYHRLAATMRELSAIYQRDAEREETRTLYDE